MLKNRSSIVVSLLYPIAAKLYQKRQSRINASKNTERGDSADAYWKWQHESSSKYFELFGGLMNEIKGQRILDLGCGIGGRTCFLAENGVGEIVGTDINVEEIEKANAFAKKHLLPKISHKVSFIAVDEQTPPDLGCFDIVLLVDSMEHLRDPVGIIDLAYSYLKPGGVCYFSTMGWYNHRGSHINSIIPIPFINVFFSDKTILEVIRRIVSSDFFVPSQWDSVPPVKRWQGLTNLSDRPDEHLNKITIAGIRRTVKKSAFGGGTVHVEGFSKKRLGILSFLNILAKIPIIQEVYHSAVFGKLTKEQ